MASYNSILRHVSMADVKRNTWKLQEQKRVEELCRQEEINLIKNNNSPEYSDWRCASLNENMTTSDIMFTTFPATDEVSLETINAANAGSFTSAGGQLALNGTSIKASGSGSGEDGGFNLGQSYLAFDGDASSRHAILDPIDSSTFDTLNISAIVGNDYNGGEDPDEAGAELRLYYLEPGGSSFKSISVTPSGDQVLSANSDVIIGLGDGNGSLQEFSISLPAHARGAGFTYMLYQLVNSGPGFDHYGITSINYKRRSPVSLFVALDSPEATSFIGDGSGNLSPAEKKKRLQDMLSASSEYMDKKFPYNKAAIKDAETNLRNNDIDIDVSIDTFKFPTYGSPEFNRMFNPTISAYSSKDDVKNYLETKGLTLDVDTLNKDFKVGNGWFESLGAEGTMSLLNNPETQELALTAMGVDFNIITNLTDDSYDELYKATYFRPGGTPSTGWDGKFYHYDDPLLQASQIVPLETYLEAKKRDGWYGVERPDRAEPGYRYVLEKKYSWREDGEVKYTSVQNDTLSKQASELARLSVTTGGDYDLGINYYYGRYVRSGRPAYLLRELASIVGNKLNYVYRNLSYSAYGWVERNSEQRVDSKLDPRTEFDPLWVFDFKGSKGALEAIKGISSGRDLDSDVSYYTYSTDSRETKLEKERLHKEENDWYYNYVKEALERFEGINDALVFEKDDWYQGKREIIEITDVHPYIGLRPEATPQQPQEPSKTNDSYMNIQVGDEQIIKQGNQTLVDTLKGIDNREYKKAIEQEMDRVKKLPAPVRSELRRLLDIAGTTEVTPPSQKTKKEIEDYWASLPPERISEIEGRTQAHGVDAIGLGLAILAGLGLGAAGATSALTSAVTKGINKVKSLAKTKPTPSKVKYGSGSSQPKTTPKDVKFDPKKPGGGKEWMKAARDWQRQNPGKYNPYRTDAVNKMMKDQGVGTQPNPNPKFSKPQYNSYEPEGNSLMENNNLKTKHNEKITKNSKIKSPKEFFKQADVKPIHPDNPPPKLIKGRHPDFYDDTKIAKRFTKLDPISAKSMPDTGSPQVDALVRAARKKPK